MKKLLLLATLLVGCTYDFPGVTETPAVSQPSLNISVADLPFRNPGDWRMTPEGIWEFQGASESPDTRLMQPLGRKVLCGDPCGPLAHNVLIRNRTVFNITFDACSGTILSPAGFELYVLCEERAKIAAVSMPLFICGPILSDGSYANPDCIMFRGYYELLPGATVPVIVWDFS